MQNRKQLLALAILMLAGCSGQSHRSGPLQIDVPAGWSLNFTTPQTMPRYEVFSSDRQSELVLYQPPQTVKPTDIPRLMTDLAGGFVMAATNGGFAHLNDPVTVQTLTGPEFHGNYFVAHLQERRAEVTHVSFMLSDGGPIWAGQFIGTQEAWSKAIEVLRTLKKTR